MKKRYSARFNNVDSGEVIHVFATDETIGKLYPVIWTMWYPKEACCKYESIEEHGHYGDDFLCTEDLGGTITGRIYPDTNEYTRDIIPGSAEAEPLDPKKLGLEGRVYESPDQDIGELPLWPIPCPGEPAFTIPPVAHTNRTPEDLANIARDFPKGLKFKLINLILQTI